jgi:epoxyqueuosine reductase
VPAWGVTRPTVSGLPDTEQSGADRRRPARSVTAPAHLSPTAERGDLGADLLRLGRSRGLAAVGITSADPFESTRADLVGRKDRGLHAGMQFTYRNPERSTDPRRLLPGARALVVGAWGYRRRDEPGTATRGRVAGYAQRDYYASLRVALEPIAEHLVELGWRAAVVCDDNGLVDRAAAHRAGLGWFGKNSLILLPGLGSWFVLGSVVTDAPLVAPAPREPAAPAAGCGSCDRCRSACPTRALVEPGVLDAGKCLAWLVQATGSFPVEHRRALGGRIYGCDECQQVCPINRLADRRHPPRAPEPDTVSAVDLVELLDASDAELLEAFGRWYIPGRDARYLRRNALIALGNVGDPDDPATRRVVLGWAAADDPMLAEHAGWAARELGLDQPGLDQPGLDQPGLDQAVM